MTTILDRPPPPSGLGLSARYGSLSPSRIWRCRVSACEDTCCRWKVDRLLTPRPQPLISLSPRGSIPFPQTSRTNDSSCWTNAGPWGQHAIYPSVAGFGRDAGIQGIHAVMTVIYTGLCVFGMFEDGSSAKSMSVQGHLFNLFPVFSRSNFDELFFS